LLLPEFKNFWLERWIVYSGGTKLAKPKKLSVSILILIYIFVLAPVSETVDFSAAGFRYLFQNHTARLKSHHWSLLATGVPKCIIIFDKSQKILLVQNIAATTNKTDIKH
jgi:hypothetical protein